MTEPVDPHWRARLSEIQDLLLVAHDADSVARAVILLTAVLQDEWGSRATEGTPREAALPAAKEVCGILSPYVLQQLVRDAYDLLTNPETQINLHQWTRAAAPWLRSGS